MSFALKAARGSGRAEPRRAALPFDAEASADAGLGIPLNLEPSAWSVPGESCGAGPAWRVRRGVRLPGVPADGSAAPPGGHGDALLRRRRPRSGGASASQVNISEADGIDDGLLRPLRLPLEVVAVLRRDSPTAAAGASPGRSRPSSSPSPPSPACAPPRLRSAAARRRAPAAPFPFAPLPPPLPPDASAFAFERLRLAGAGALPAPPGPRPPPTPAPASPRCRRVLPRARRVHTCPSSAWRRCRTCSSAPTRFPAAAPCPSLPSPRAARAVVASRACA